MAIEIIKQGKIILQKKEFTCSNCNTEFLASKPDLQQELDDWKHLQWKAKCPVCFNLCCRGLGDEERRTD